MREPHLQALPPPGAGRPLPCHGRPAPAQAKSEGPWGLCGFYIWRASWSFWFPGALAPVAQEIEHTQPVLRFF